MHEASLVSDMIEQLLRKRSPASAGRIRSVRVRVSSGESPEALREAFHLLAAGTPFERAALDIEMETVGVSCVCGKAFTASEDSASCGVAECPACGAICPVAHGHALDVLQLVADE